MSRQTIDTDRDERPPLPDAMEIVRGRWEPVLEAAGLGAYLGFTRKEGPCPLCGGNTRFRFLDLEESGKFFCGHCEDLSNHIGFGWHLLQKTQGFTFPEACAFVKKVLGVTNGAPDQMKALPLPAVRKKEADAEELRHRCLKLWNKGIEITKHDAAGRYLMRRVPELTSFPDTLRFIPQMEYYEALSLEEKRKTGKEYRLVGSFPGMLAYCQGSSGDLANVWRWFLTPEGEKADVESPKKALVPHGISSELAVRLGPPGPEIATGEGLEGLLRVQARTGISGWPSMNEGLLQKFTVPAGLGIECIYIYGDHDEPKKKLTGEAGLVRAGDVAAANLRDKLKREGYEALIRLPASTDYDFGDIG